MHISDKSVRRIAQQMDMYSQPLEELFFSLEGLPEEFAIGIVEEVEVMTGTPAPQGMPAIDALRDMLDPQMIETDKAVAILQRAFSQFGIQ